ncbi:MAG: hypothetical protein ACK4ND_05360 [Cytophagaceae bacterium]
MAVTRLQRKGKRNKITAKGRIANIKFLTRKPVIKRVEVEELKKQEKPGVVEKAVKEVKKVAEKVEDAIKGEE